MTGPDPEIPSARELRWPVLVALDDMGEEDSILDSQDRIAQRLALSAGAADVMDRGTHEPLLTERLIQAIDDLSTSQPRRPIHASQPSAAGSRRSSSRGSDVR